MDPLSLLREFTKNKRPVVLENDVFTFEDVKFPRNVETNFLRRKGEGEPYTLDAIWFMLHHADQKYTDYLADCKKYNFPLVSLVDRRDMVSYLTGETDHCVSISNSGSLGLPIPVSRSGVQIPVLGSQDSSIEIESGDLEDNNNSKRQKIEKETNLKAQLLAEKEQVAKRLDAPRIKSELTDVAVDLGEGMTGEKINELKKKRALVRRTTIKDDEIEGKESSATKSKFVEADIPITKDIVDKERVIRTRTSILQSNKKHFTSIINTVTIALKREEQQKQAEHKKKSATYDRYQDVQEDKFWKERLKGNEPEEFQIDTRGTFADSGRIPDVSIITKPKHKPKPKPVTPSPNKHQEKDAIPIIIVPAALSSLLTMYNVKEFIADGVFVSSIDKKNAGAKKDVSTIVERKKPNSNLILRYQIIDNVAKLSIKDWDKVIAVFASGAEWQFKDWHWPTPVEIFSKVRGFFLRYEDENVPEKIRSWDVKILTVSKTQTRRHVAQTAMVEFWDAVDLYLRSKKMDQFDSVYY